MHIHFTVFDRVETRIIKCPNCKRRRKFLCEHQDWYGWLDTCLTCGDRWQDGEMLPRPSERDWRKGVVDKAKQRLSKTRFQLTQKLRD